jgi:ketosteroid isomerase-like protein
MSRLEIDVLEANAAFYRAFADHDAKAMEALWSEAAPVACVHPGWDVIEGRDEVLRSWRAILASPSAPAIRCRQAAARVLGDVAYVLCREDLPGAHLAATNVFVRERGTWRMVHHQATPIAPGQEQPARRPAGPVN